MVISDETDCERNQVKKSSDFFRGSTLKMLSKECHGKMRTNRIFSPANKAVNGDRFEPQHDCTLHLIDFTTEEKAIACSCYLTSMTMEIGI